MNRSILETRNRMLRLQFRRVLGSLIAVIAIVVVGNNLLFAQIRSPQNASIAQMIPGWTRQFKPLLYDHVKPQAIAFGASWVRDAFDPEMMERLTGEKFFNFGVSGGSSFESFRLAQSAFFTHPPERIYLHLESFFDAPRATRLRHGFDERILHLDETGEPTRFVGFYRALKINFSGSALGFGYRFLTAKFALARGAQREDVLSPFQRHDYLEDRDRLTKLGRDLFDENTDRPAMALRGASARRNSFETLKRMIDLACDARTDVHVFQLPTHITASGLCPMNSGPLLAVMHELRPLAATCQANLTLHSFRYLNSIALEGTLNERRLSQFFRPDFHPRPTVGQLMATRIHELAGGDTGNFVPDDFGVDLLSMSDRAAEAWVSERRARCSGDWAAGALDKVRSELDYLSAGEIE